MSVKNALSFMNDKFIIAKHGKYQSADMTSIRVARLPVILQLQQATSVCEVTMTMGGLPEGEISLMAARPHLGCQYGLPKTSHRSR